MIEKIYISRNEVLHYEWLNTTKMDVTCVDSVITRETLFMRTIKAVIRSGIKNTYSENIKVSCSDKSIGVSLDKKEIVDVVIKACDWILSNDLSYPDPTKDIAVFYLNNKENINQFFEELKKMLSEKNYQYSYQSVDGRD